MLNLIIIIIIIVFFLKKKTQSNPIQLDLYGLHPCDVLGWVRFFNPPWWNELKKPFSPTQPDPCTLPLSWSQRIKAVFVSTEIDFWKIFSLFVGVLGCLKVLVNRNLLLVNYKIKALLA